MHKKFNFLFTYSLVVMIFIIFGGIVYFLFIPNPYLTPFLLGWINKQGWGAFEVERIALYPHEIHLKNVKYMPAPQIPPLTMGSADLKIVWNNFSPKIENVVLNNLLISKETIENMMQGPSTDSFAIPPITFRNALLISEDSEFPFTLSFDAKFVLGTSLDGKFQLKFSSGTLQGSAKALLSSPHLKTVLSHFSLKLNDWDHPPISGQGELAVEGDTINTTITSNDPDLKFKGQCLYGIQERIGNCTIAYQSDKLATLIPKQWLQSYSLQDLSGAFKGSASFKIKDNILEPLKGEVILSNLSFEHPHAKTKNFSTALKYNFDKNLTFPKQNIKILIDKADIGIPVSNLQLLLLWDGANHYHLQEGHAFLEGGQIITKNVSLSLPFQKIQLPLKLKNIPAQFFVTLSHVPSLIVSGNVEGQLNMEFTNHDYAIKKGSFLAIQDPPGKIRYRPGLKPNKIPVLTGDENPMDLVFLALWNFKYDKLSLELERPFDGELQAILHVKGKNPNLLKGHPFEFNIKATGQLKELIENLFQSIKNP